MKTEQFEAELTRHLGPVQAPDELWGRVVQGAAGRASVPRWGARQWAAVSLATLALAAGIRVGLNRDLSGEERAVRALSRTQAQMEFRSGDPAELRTWVKTGTGLDVPLPERLAPSVQVIGANLTGGSAEISYRVGGLDAALVVSKLATEGDGRHTLVKNGSYQGASFLSWTMRGQMYTIASADARLGCILCHST